MDVRAENRGRLHQKKCVFLCGEKLFVNGHPGVRVRNVRGFLNFSKIQFFFSGVRYNFAYISAT